MLDALRQLIRLTETHHIAIALFLLAIVVVDITIIAISYATKY